MGSTKSRPTDREPAAGLTVAEEREYYRHLDLILRRVSQLLATHGAWAEFILGLLEDVRCGREDPQRVLLGRKDVWAEFADACSGFIEEIRGASELCATKFYNLASDETLVGFLEPGCATSPVVYRTGTDGQIDVLKNPNLPLMFAGEGSQRFDELLDEYVAAQAALMRLLWNVPLRPNYLLERLEDFEVELKRYRDQVEAYRTWQADIVGENEGIDDTAGAQEEMYRAQMWGSVRAARLFPADLIDLHRRLNALGRELRDTQGVILIQSGWLVRTAMADYRGAIEQRGLPADDLQADAMAHLARLMRTFDWHFGVRFTTYANRDISSFVRDRVFSTAGQFRIPAGTARLLDRVRGVYLEMATRTGLHPTSRMVAEQMELPVDTVRSLLLVAGPQVSLQAPIRRHAEGDRAVHDIIPAGDDRGGLSALQRDDDGRLLETILGRLEQDERMVLNWYYGIGGHPRLHTFAIAQRMRMPAAHVQSRVEEIVRKLRAALASLPEAAEVLARHLVSGEECAGDDNKAAGAAPETG